MRHIARFKIQLLLSVLVLFLFGYGTCTPPPTSPDGGSDGGLIDAGSDSGKDSGLIDAGSDSGVDSGPAACVPSAPAHLGKLTKPEVDLTAASADICPKTGKPNQARCLSKVVVKSPSRVRALGASLPYGYGPAQFHTGYGLPYTANTVQHIAIVIAFSDPNTKSDLDTYDTTYGLPAFPSCTSTLMTSCFRKVNQNGAASPLPTFDQGWALEESMDVQTAHEICPNCTLTVVEANSSNFSDLAIAENTAASLGANVISNSFGGSDSSQMAAFNHPGVAIVASSGDNGYAGGPSAPASFNTVIAVGGTTLNLNPDNTWASETVWTGAGSGCSTLNTAQPWQVNAIGWAATGCGSQRGIADVSANADPATGAAVYHTASYNGQSGWFTVGGTSLSAPIIAGVYGLQGDEKSVSYPSAFPYARTRCLHDVTSGTNGSCSTTICRGSTGYDGPSGIGTPFGISSF